MRLFLYLRLCLAAARDAASKAFFVPKLAAALNPPKAAAFPPAVKAGTAVATPALRRLNFP